jgi:DNA-binding LytR/AlgR family response regulator
MVNDNCLIIFNREELARVFPDRIAYIASDGNYSTLVLTDGEERVFTINLSEFENRIENQLKADAHQFIRIGKSLIINKNHIYYINPSRQQLLLKERLSGKCFELSASKEALRQLKTVIESPIKD